MVTGKLRSAVEIGVGGLASCRHSSVGESAEGPVSLWVEMVCGSLHEGARVAFRGWNRIYFATNRGHTRKLSTLQSRSRVPHSLFSVSPLGSLSLPTSSHGAQASTPAPRRHHRVSAITARPQPCRNRSVALLTPKSGSQVEWHSAERKRGEDAVRAFAARTEGTGARAECC